jgi:hypothetical protein
MKQGVVKATNNGYLPRQLRASPVFLGILQEKADEIIIARVLHTMAPPM